MQITLIHNPTAGRGNHASDDLIRPLRRARHHVSYYSVKKSPYNDALKKPTELVLAAGGDGTVAKIARRLLDTGIPLSILPLGTANNLARTLRFNELPSKIGSTIHDRSRRLAP